MIRIWFLSLFILIGITSWGQNPKTLSEIEKKYPFLHAENALLKHYGDKQAAQYFFEKLIMLNLCGEGRINVTHFGGSHVQAGTLSRTLWRNLQSLYPDAPGSPGFVFPFNLAKTNNPRHYKTESRASFESIRSARPSEHARWGMAAITAKTMDTTGFFRMFNQDDDNRYWKFDRFRVYTPIGDSCFALFPDSNLPVIETIIDTMAGMIEYVLDKEVTEVVMHWKKTDSLQKVLYIDGVQLLNDKPGITYHAMGANGNSTNSLVRSEALWPQLKYLHSDLVVFGVGINDAHKSQSAFSEREYADNYRKIIDSLRAVNPKVALLFVTNNDSYYKNMPNPNAKKVQRIMQELATEYGGWVFDLFNYMGGMNASQIWEHHGLGKRDKIHFTNDGYRIQADAMFQAIQHAFFDYLSQTYAEPLVP
ncbi:MAG: hypothetical protein JJU02_09810 [Cryomorphaceae bacterium]|nr:hypothetical protein [Cryomorphaceae bacterium]